MQWQQSPGLRSAQPIYSRARLEIIIHHDPVIAAREPAQNLEIAARLEHPHGAVAEAELCPGGMAAAERLRGRAVDDGARLVDVPHHIADPDRPVSKPGHTRP